MLEILLHTPDSLVLRDTSARTQVAMGPCFIGLALLVGSGLLAGVGQWLTQSPHPGGNGQMGGGDHTLAVFIIVVAVTAAFAAAGVLMITGAAETTYVLDRAANTFTYKRQRKGGSNQWRVPLDQIVDVMLDEGDETYGVQLHFRGRQPLSLCAVLTSDQRGAQQGVDLIRDFLHLPPSPSVLDMMRAQFATTWRNLRAVLAGQNVPADTDGPGALAMQAFSLLRQGKRPEAAQTLQSAIAAYRAQGDENTARHLAHVLKKLSR